MTKNITANADTKHPLSETDKAWLGGVLDVYGALAVVLNNGKKTVALRFKTNSKLSAMRQIGTLLEITPKPTRVNGHQALYFQLSGTPLHGVMTMVWPYLTTDRKREYAAKRLEVKAWEQDRESD